MSLTLTFRSSHTHHTAQYVPIKAICEELTSYGFSYKFGGSSPIIQPWKLSEGKARKVGLLFEGEKAIRKFWEEQVRPKLPDEFYKYVSLMSDCLGSTNDYESFFCLGLGLTFPFLLLPFRFRVTRKYSQAPQRGLHLLGGRGAQDPRI